MLRENSAGDPLEYNPRVYPAYTTSRVLTLEYLSGVAVIDIITAIRRQRHGIPRRPRRPRITIRGASPATSCGTR